MRTPLGQLARRNRSRSTLTSTLIRWCENIPLDVEVKRVVERLDRAKSPANAAAGSVPAVTSLTNAFNDPHAPARQT
jgi:hypothetical protein